MRRRADIDIAAGSTAPGSAARAAVSGDFAGNVSSSRTASLARLRSCAPRALTIDGARTRDFAGNGPFLAHLRRSSDGPPWVRLILVDECSRPERQRRVRADAVGLRRARGRSRGFVGPAAHQDHHRSTSGELQSMPAIVPSGCLAIHRATARKFWRLRIGPQLEPLGKDCPHTRTKVDTRYPGVPCQDDDVFVPSSRGETAAVCGVQSD